MGDHWYNHLGEPAYNTGLREARKLKLLPSITTVDKMIANPGLEIWKQNIILDTAMEYPLDSRIYESVDEYKSFIKQEAFRESRQSAKLGTVVHHMAERYIKGKPLFFKGNRPDVWKIFEPLRDWIDCFLVRPDDGFMKNEGAEVILVNESLGYAGKADFVGRSKTSRTIIVDFKTTFIKPKDIKKDGHIGKAKLYDSWVRQLAALSACRITDCLLSVVISTNQDFPGVWVHEWSYDDIEEAWIQFQAALNIFISIKGLNKE